jgi:putative tryptophan/tyrosine transport system substrate-binding protein
VRLKVDAIVAGGSSSTRAAEEATTSIPIVMAMDPDPVSNGFVASPARPGGNISGMSTLGRGPSGKRLELLKETAPSVSGAAVRGDAIYVGNAETLRETEPAAGVLAVRLGYLHLQDHKDLAALVQAASKGRPDAAVVLGGPGFISQRRQLVDLAAPGRLSAMYPFPEFVEGGGLMSYAVSVTDAYRRAAAYVDKILKEAKPADLPVEQPTVFDFLVNLQTARALGLSIPPSVLAQATEINQ